MDLAAANSARRLLYGTEFNGSVTAHLSEVDFIQPAHLGDFVELETRVTKLGNSSITLCVSVHSENLAGQTQPICKANFIMVALRDGKPYSHGKSLE